MKKENILLVSNTFYNLFNFRYSLVKYLHKNYKIILSASDDNYVKYFYKLGIDTKKISFVSRDYNIFNNLKVLIFFKKLITKNKIDTVISFTIKPNLFFCILKIFFKYKLIITISGMGEVYLNKSLLNRAIFYIYVSLLNNANSIFCHNKHDKYLLIKMNKKLKKKITLVYGSGVNFNKYKFSAVTFKKKISFLLSARIIREKGILEYIDAAKKISHLYPNKVEFLIIGSRYKDSKFDAIFQKEISSSPIKFIDHVNDIRPFIKKSSCIVLPSYREGLSKIILEALAIGRPIIATNVPGCSELVISGYNGYLIKSQSQISLFNALVKFIHLPNSSKNKYSKNSREYSYKFNEETVIKSYLKQLEK